MGDSDRATWVAPRSASSIPAAGEEHIYRASVDWGGPAAAAMTALITRRADRGKPLTWIEIGSVAGATAQIPSAALRAARLQIIGSGQDSVSPRECVAELPALAQEIASGTLAADARAMPLAGVEAAWAAAGAKQRIVLTPPSPSAKPSGG